MVTKDGAGYGKPRSKRACQNPCDWKRLIPVWETRVPGSGEKGTLVPAKYTVVFSDSDASNTFPAEGRTLARQREIGVAPSRESIRLRVYERDGEARVEPRHISSLCLASFYGSSVLQGCFLAFEPQNGHDFMWLSNPSPVTVTSSRAHHVIGLSSGLGSVPDSD
jgi:hypothetical protein